MSVRFCAASNGFLMELRGKKGAFPVLMLLLFHSAVFLLKTRMPYPSDFVVIPGTSTSHDINEYFLPNNNTGASLAFHHERLRIARRKSSQSENYSSFRLYPEDFEPLLSVPFYVYEELMWFSDALLLLKGDTEPTVSLRDYRYAPTGGLVRWNEKHADDFWFLEAAMKHPMRTHDPAAATFFLVPALFNHWSDFNWFPESSVQAVCKGNSSGHNCFGKLQLTKIVNGFVGASMWFRRFGGADHIMVCSHYSSVKWLHWRGPGSRNSINLLRVNQITFEKFPPLHPDRLYLSSFYMGTECPESESHDKIADVAMVANMKFENRRQICEWIAKHNISNSICASGDQCPALVQARYGFHVAGDTLGSNRLIDLLVSGVVPIMTDPGQYDILPSFIDWRALTVLVNHTAGEEAFIDQLRAVLSNETLYHEKRVAILSNSDLVDWRTGVPFDVYMHAFELQLPSFLQAHGRDNETVAAGVHLAAAVQEAHQRRQKEQVLNSNTTCSKGAGIEAKKRHSRYSALLF